MATVAEAVGKTLAWALRSLNPVAKFLSETSSSNFLPMSTLSTLQEVIHDDEAALIDVVEWPSNKKLDVERSEGRADVLVPLLS